jgi:hypothetical protein
MLQIPAREIKYLHLVATGFDKDESVASLTRTHKVCGGLDCYYHYVLHHAGRLLPARKLSEPGLGSPDTPDINRHSIVVGVCVRSLGCMFPKQKLVTDVLTTLLTGMFPGLVVIRG